jgi:ubiquinone/menaquinone biosynthesis C-methylase UbiE
MAAGAAFFRQVPRAVAFDGVRTVVDVGGGAGQLLSQVLAAVPTATGILIDRAEAIEVAAKYLARQGLLDRCSLRAGDFTNALPSDGDVYLLARVLHDWDDQMCERILRTCRDAMPPHARLLVIERPIPAARSASLAILWDLHMMANNVGGRERTTAEYRDLLGTAGFTVTAECPLSLDMTVQIAQIR